MNSLKIVSLLLLMNIFSATIHAMDKKMKKEEDFDVPILQTPSGASMLYFGDPKKLPIFQEEFREKFGSVGTHILKVSEITQVIANS